MSKTFGQASFQRTDVASAATTVLTAVTTRRVRITGTTNISAMTMNAWQILEAEFSGASLTITHNATTLNLPNNGNNLTVRQGDTCTLAADGSGNVTMFSYTPRTVRDRLSMAQNGVIDFGGACNIAESGDAINFNNAAAGYVFNGGQIIGARSGSCMSLINGQDVNSVEVASFEGDRATPTANDAIYCSYRVSSSTGAQSEAGRWGMRATDVTNASIDGAGVLWLPVNSTMAERYLWTPTAFTPATNDAAALGTISVGWADMYLASGGFVDFAAGDMRITHNVAGTMDFTGAGAGYAFGDAVSAMCTINGGIISSRVDGTAPTQIILDNFTITTTDQGSQLAFRLGTGGSLGGTAGSWQILTTEDWSSGPNRSAKIRFNVRTDDSLTAELELTKGATVRPGTGIVGGGDINGGWKGTSTANFGVFFGSGVPTISAAKGSLYLRSDGSSTTTRIYVATDSAGTWTHLTAGA